MDERFKLVLIELVCVDVQAPDIARYKFKKEYLAIKDSKDKIQPYGIIRSKDVDVGKLLIVIRKSNKLGRATTELCFCEKYDDVSWELKDEYKFKEVE